MGAEETTTTVSSEPEVIPAQPPGSAGFEAALSGIFDEPGSNADFAGVDLSPPRDEPKETPPADVPPVAPPAPKPGSFKALKQEKDAEREAEVARVRQEYDEKIAGIMAQATEHETTAKTFKERAEQAETLREAHAARLAELEKQAVADYETPYSLQVDPEAMPHLAAFEDARAIMDAAVKNVATGLAEDSKGVSLIASNKAIFGQLMVGMLQGDNPDVVHAQSLVAEMSKIGVVVAPDEARQAIRELKGALPALSKLANTQRALTDIEARNRPQWTQQQAARHEAYRRTLTSAADVSDDASEGDDAVLAGILKGKPELRAKLNAEADRLSALVIGPAPGKATVESIRAAPKHLHETAIKAARLPVVLSAYQQVLGERAEMETRIKDLEDRLAKQSGSVPRQQGTGTPPPPGKAKSSDFEAVMAQLTA